MLKIEFDAAKRERTLLDRDVDFARALEIFENHNYTELDTRKAYGEERYITAGRLDGRMMLVAWTPRGEVRRIISMRKCNAREQAFYAKHLG